MARKLINLCAVLALLAGCWGGVLAAAACPHAGCETTAAAPESTAAHGEHEAGHGPGSVSPEDHSGHAGPQGKGHSAAPPAHNPPRVDPAQLRGAASNRHDPNCAHCAGDAEAPPSRHFEWQSNSFKSGEKLIAPRAAGQVSAASAVFVREITPAQHAPPGTSDRHLLLSVFRI